MIYARQIAPEKQESPLYWGEWPENVEFFGNRSYKRRMSELFDRLPAALDELAAVWDNMQAGYHDGASWAEELAGIVPPQGRPEYTREERRHAWPDIMKNFVDDRQAPEYYCKALALITSKEWDFCTLRGSVQREWQHCIYPADEWNREQLERLESEYFNTGTEWIVHDSDEAPESPEEIEGFSVYCTAWNDDGIKKEIADAAGGSPEEVKLYKFEGWARSATYTEV